MPPAADAATAPGGRDRAGIRREPRRMTEALAEASWGMAALVAALALAGLALRRRGGARGRAAGMALVLAALGLAALWAGLGLVEVLRLATRG